MNPPLPQAILSTPYPPEAYRFLENGLSFTAKRIHGESGGEQSQDSRHISGAQLSEGLREYALQEYGLFARFVLERWRITRTRDFGEMVYAMIEAEIMRKTDDDAITDFDGVYDFASAFPFELTFSALPADCHGQD